MRKRGARMLYSNILIDTDVTISPARCCVPTHT